MNVVVWLKSKWKVIVGAIIVGLAWLLFSFGVLSAEEAFTMAMSGALFGGFASLLTAHKDQIEAALNAQQKWHEQREQFVIGPVDPERVAVAVKKLSEQNAAAGQNV